MHIVHTLKIIDIQQDYAEGDQVALGQFYFILQIRIEFSAVIQLSEFIGIRELFQGYVLGRNLFLFSVQANDEIGENEEYHHKYAE